MKKTSEHYQEIIDHLKKAHEKANQMSLEYTCHKIWSLLNYLFIAQKTEKDHETKNSGSGKKND